jgi:hypothetical protein
MPPTMKRLLIRVSGSTRPPFKIQIRPGTTCQDILDHLELRGYVLAPASEPLHQFLPEMDMFRHLRGGAAAHRHDSPGGGETLC